MTDNLIFNVNVDLLLRAGITINQFLMMQFFANNKVKLYQEYREIFPNPITENDLKYLLQKGYIITKNGQPKFTFENVAVTDSFYELAFINKDVALAELSENYPKKTPQKGRRLQSDPDKWQKKYLSIINKDRTLHDKIMLCIKAEKLHRQQTNSEEFWPLLTTYINNKRWEDYLDEIDNVHKKEMENTYDI